MDWGGGKKKSLGAIIRELKFKFIVYFYFQTHFLIFFFFRNIFPIRASGSCQQFLFLKTLFRMKPAIIFECKSTKLFLLLTKDSVAAKFSFHNEECFINLHSKSTILSEAPIFITTVLIFFSVNEIQQDTFLQNLNCHFKYKKSTTEIYFQAITKIKLL